jgi:hypothetical protein
MGARTEITGWRFIRSAREVTETVRGPTGAQVKLAGGKFVSYDQAKGGMSYCSAQDPRLHFGLAAHDKVDSIEID